MAFCAAYKVLFVGIKMLLRIRASPDYVSTFTWAATNIFAIFRSIETLTSEIVIEKNLLLPDLNTYC